ncbi:MAG: hypothetical protein ACI9CV_002063, partial [Ilumatobacter sp.]
PGELHIPERFDEPVALATGFTEQNAARALP